MSEFVGDAEAEPIGWDPSEDHDHGDIECVPTPEGGGVMASTSDRHRQQEHAGSLQRADQVGDRRLRVKTKRTSR